MLDAATVRDAGRVLFPDGDRTLSERHIAATGQVLEALAFFDRVLVPALDGSPASLRRLVAPFGEAMTVVKGSADIVRIRETASAWIATEARLAELVGIVDGGYTTNHNGWGTRYEPHAISGFGLRDRETAQVQAITEWGGESRIPVGPARRKGKPRLRGCEPEKPARGRLAEALASAGIPEMIVGIVADGAVAGDLALFGARLAWTTWRTRCHQLVAEEHGVPYLPHTLRARLAGYCLARPGRRSWNFDARPPVTEDYLATWQRGLRADRHTVNERLRLQLTGCGLTFVLPGVVRIAERREDVLDVAYTLRDMPWVTTFRRDLGDWLAAADPSREPPRSRSPVAPIVVARSTAGGPASLLRDVLADMKTMNRPGDVHDILVPPRQDWRR
ncbi:hypothetical protein Acsp01_45230 [Actinoplanes sp. NBRC 101535]|nr:hypothetical protein Acsp01_45230 [Actinoplanes sp. NBRC 101535]